MFLARLPKTVFCCLTLALLAACVGQRSSLPENEPPATWSRTSDNAGDVALNWLSEASSLDTLVREALASNFQLAQQRQALEDARLSVIIAGGDRWPSLSAGLGASRRDSDSSYDLDASLAWEIDLWGKLSDSQRAARLDYEADRASYEAARRDLVARTVSLAYDATSARQLLALFQRRLVSLESTFDIVSGSYQRGLVDALDVYLAQNALEQQRATVAAQEQLVLESAADLQLLLGRYPDGDLALPATVPLEQTPIPVGLPSELLTRRQDIASAWLALLAADARVAVAQKNRFPRLSMTAAGGTASDNLDELVDSDFSTWSLAANLTQPIFQSGRLRAAQHQAEARAVSLEQNYLLQVYSAFGEVENAISGNTSLNSRYDSLQSAEHAALAAQELSLQQYRRGLVTFTTVLEADRRAFDTSSALVRVRNELAQNRVDLYTALGGEFLLDDSP